MGRVERLINGDVRALARAISTAEEDAAGAAALLREVFHLTGRSVVVGVTGPPGAGKSSLVDRLITHYRRASKKVGVVAVDPSSAYSGGAILGDRVRMQQHATDPGVFIRSMATRGNLGGLSKAANDAIDLLDAAGYDPIILETVGVGQDEIEVARSADVVAVVLVPGMGDDIQAIKAGILEIADLFVINKADRPGADRVEADLAYMLSLVADEERGAPEILRTVAVRDEGVTELIEGIARYLERAGPDRRARRRRERAESRFLGLLRERLLGRVLEDGLAAGDLERTVRAIADRQTDPYTAVEEILARVEVR
jgi:LAO/AO transport system kinase